MTDRVYKRLLAEAKSSRVQASLKAINETCKELLKNGSTKFTIATVSRAGLSYGVPKAQSMRNKSGARYKELIDAWKHAHSLPATTKSKKQSEWIEKIEDPTVRYLVHELAAHNSSLEAELQLHRSVKTFEIDMRETIDHSDLDRGDIFLFDTELASLRDAISESTLSEHGLRVSSRGALLKENGDIMFERGFVSAIEKVINSQAP